METPLTSTDAIEVLRAMAPATIRARLVQIEAEKTALMTILRSVRAREAVLARYAPTAGGEHA
jgi:hypothetical protein